MYTNQKGWSKIIFTHRNTLIYRIYMRFPRDLKNTKTENLFYSALYIGYLSYVPTFSYSRRECIHMDMLWCIYLLLYWLTLPLSELITTTYCKAMLDLLPIFWAHKPLDLKDNSKRRIAGLNRSQFYLLRDHAKIFSNEIQTLHSISMIIFEDTIIGSINPFGDPKRQQMT